MPTTTAPPPYTTIRPLGEIKYELDGLFCGDKCGCRCTRVDYVRSLSYGEALRVRMGEGWEVEVWENGGWHYKVRKGVLELHPQRQIGDRAEITGYIAFFNTATQFVSRAEEPEDAVGFAVQDARSHMSRIEADLQRLLGDA